MARMTPIQEHPRPGRTRKASRVMGLTLAGAVAALFSCAVWAQQAAPSKHGSTQPKTSAPAGAVSTTGAERAEIAKAITEKIQALRGSGGDPAQVALRVAQYEFYLAALESMGREEQIKTAAQRQGERIQGQLLQVGSEAKQHISAIEKAIK